MFFAAAGLGKTTPTADQMIDRVGGLQEGRSDGLASIASSQPVSATLPTPPDSRGAGAAGRVHIVSSVKAAAGTAMGLTDNDVFARDADVFRLDLDLIERIVKIPGSNR